jgi:ribosome-binding protein aMBF1 (putative translation factor)
MKPNNKSSLEKILEGITPEQQARTDVKMLLAARIADAMEAKGWNNKMLMEALDKKNPSEITRWLSGTHNFTVDTLADLGRVLERDFINLSPEKE